MNRIQIQHKITQILHSIARAELNVITSDSHLHKDLGIDSMDLLVVRESVERSFAIFVADEEASCLNTVSSITDLVERKLLDHGQSITARPETLTMPHSFGGKYL